MRKLLIAIMLIITTSVATHAQQVVYSQNFEDTTKLFQDYVLSNLDKADPAGTDLDTLASVAWYVGVAGLSDNHAAIGTSNYDPAAAADDWFITPAIRLGEQSVLSFKSFSMVSGTTDTYNVYISTVEQSVTGCLFNPVLAQFSCSNSTAFETHNIDLALGGYANKTVYIGFRLNTASGGDILAIDDIAVTENVTQFHSLTFNVNMSKYIADDLFNPRTDTVDIAGTFNSFDGTKNILSIVPASDSAIYTATIGGFLDGDRLEFKFRVNSTWHDSIVEFPYGQPNRVWVIETGEYTYSCFYNDQGTSFGIPDDLMGNVHFYPNPAHDLVSVEVPKAISKMILLGMTGSKLMEYKTSSINPILLDINTLPTGTYLMLFYSKDGFAGSKKLLKR